MSYGVTGSSKASVLRKFDVRKPIDSGAIKFEDVQQRQRTLVLLGDAEVNNLSATSFATDHLASNLRPAWTRNGRVPLSVVAYKQGKKRWLIASKRCVDILGSVVLSLIFSPLILVVVSLLLMTGGSVIFKHKRIGEGGRTFQCLKFRTMVRDADKRLSELLKANPELKAEWIRDHKLKDDPRITWMGRFLRRTSLDELPQLWNI